MQGQMLALHDYYKRQIDIHGRDYVLKIFFQMQMGSQIKTTKNGDILAEFDITKRELHLEVLANALGYPTSNGMTRI